MAWGAFAGRKWAVGTSSQGRLFVIGGSEDKRGARAILRAVAAEAMEDDRGVALVTSATESPAAAAERYRAVFADLGVRHISHLGIDTREQAYDPRALEPLAGSPVVFFTGGNQLRLTAHLGDTPVMRRIRAIYEGGGTLAGTSAGAVAMGERMPFEYLDVTDPQNVRQAAASFHILPGFALLPGTIIDSHFAARGRMWRLFAALHEHPAALAIGLDEDTAIRVDGSERFTVLGSGNVYLLDGADMVGVDDSPDGEPEAGIRLASLADVRAHVLGAGDTFHLGSRRAALRAELAAAGLPRE